MNNIKIALKYVSNINKLINKQNQFVDNNISKYKIFNDAFLINLNSRIDRFENCKHELNKIDIKFNRFKAVEYKGKINRPFTSNGQIGCLKSHESLLLNNIYNEYPILIMEDDLMITDEFKLIYNYFDIIPKEWDLLFLYNSNKINNKDIKWIKTGTVGTHFYIVNNKSIIKILETITPCFDTIDTMYLLSNLNIYCTNHQLVVQNFSKFKSDIGGGKKLRFKIYI